MTTENLVRMSAVRLTRNRLLRRAAGGAFGLYAGLAVGVPKALATACCTGPNGTGQCGATLCTGHACHSHDPDITCHTVLGFCPGGTGCWSSGSCSGTCCDCQCCDSTGACAYCYCFGA